MLVYIIKSIPDLSLSKYQAFADAGIEGMLDAQTQFLIQLHRVMLAGKIHMHIIYDYNPERIKGKKMEIFLMFAGNDSDSIYYDKLRKIIKSSGIYSYYSFIEFEEKFDDNIYFKYMSIMKKKERLLQTIVNNEENYFYVVPNWKVKENARLYSLEKLMQSVDERCCYRIDFYVEEMLEDEIHKNFERPLSYLRNVSFKSKGISELSKMNNEKNDPNANETLKQYEEWIKNIDSTVVYRARVCALADERQYSQLLLDFAITDSLEGGNAKVFTLEKENYKIISEYDVIPQDYCIENTPNSMRKWCTTFTVEEISAFCKFPTLYDGENIEMLKETAAKFENNGIVLGLDNNDYKVVIPLELFNKHMFVCGVPGAGKTNTMLHIANSLWNNDSCKIPFLVLEPAKKEYRELALMNIPYLILFSPSARTNFPLRINPFEFAIGLTLSEHISNLCQVFEGAFPIDPPAPFILDRSIEAIYKKHKWNVDDVNDGSKTYPIMQELYEQFEVELNNTNYDMEIRGNICSVLEMRIGSLLRREKKDIFNTRTSSLRPEEWLRYPVIMELEALGEGPANFVTLLLCTLIREVLKVNPLDNKHMPVRHVIFIEEAHNLIAQQSNVDNGQDSNPKVAATSYIIKMLAEVRALREGIIIADQLPTAMAPEVIKNTNIKLVHRLTANDDRELVGSTMSASELQMENLATYTSGQALYMFEKLLRPFEMKVSLVEEHGDKTPSDDELFELMINKPKYVEIRKREIELEITGIKERIINCIETELKIRKKLNNLLLKEFNNEQKQGFLNNFVNYKLKIDVEKSSILKEVLKINDAFIDKIRKDALLTAVENINLKLEKDLIYSINNEI